MVVSWLNDAAVLIPILIGAAAVCRYVIFSRRYKLSTVKSNLKWFRRHTALTVSGLALYFAFWAVTWLLDYRGNPYCFVSYNYPEASQGLNPNGTKFAVSEMTSEELLGKTIEEEGITEVTTGQLKECLKVEPVRTDTEVSLEQPYINTEYVVQLSQKNGKINAEPNQMLSGYIDQLEEMIMEKYSRKTDRLKLNFDGLKEADYLDAGKILDSAAAGIQDFMAECKEENSSFHSQATGESFGSLEKKVSNFRSISLENFNAFVLENGLSKNREQYIGKLNYDNLLLDVEYLKNRAAYRIYLEAIDMYERDMASIVLIPTRALPESFICLGQRSEWTISLIWLIRPLMYQKRCSPKSKITAILLRSSGIVSRQIRQWLRQRKCCCLFSSSSQLSVIRRLLQWRNSTAALI